MSTRDTLLKRGDREISKVKDLCSGSIVIELLSALEQLACVIKAETCHASPGRYKGSIRVLPGKLMASGDLNINLNQLNVIP